MPGKKGEGGLLVNMASEERGKPEQKPDVTVSEPELASREKILIGGIWVEISELDDNTPFRIDGDNIVINRQKFEKEKESVTKALADSINNGDRDVFDKMTRGMAGSGDEAVLDLYIDLQKIFSEKNPKKLDSINVDLLSQGIAQRNLIREGLKPQVAKLPFIFKDRNGKRLDLENDIDIVFVKGPVRSTYGIVIGAKVGIDEIEIPEKIRPGQLQPDFLNIEKDRTTGSITIPFEKGNSERYIDTVEIRKGPIDLPAIVAREEAEEQRKSARDKKIREKERELEQERKRNRSYSPPPASSPRRSSESGGYGYVNVSG
jgi:hypothetical protein